MKDQANSLLEFGNKAGKGVARHSDIALAIAIAGILFVLLFPINVVLIDFLLAISITISLMILMTTLFIEKPLDLSVFPTMLLVTAIMRLALNIASTRLILSNGNAGPGAAGHVIEAFGNFVMGGNIVIGLIVFAIITIINFIVITKGSGRIAEVAARFSLDSMPGKQMAIDADLSAGLINEADARKRRKDLEDESTFYGAMDGANKFVRGDAIAGLLITFINLIGGIIIGMLQKNMKFNDALSTYSLLTIGDGLVAQVPALIVSLAAGLLVSKAGILGSADKAIFGQFSKYPQALFMASAIIILMAFMPGIPAIHFTVVSAITFALGLFAKEIEKQEALEAVNASKQVGQNNESGEAFYDDNMSGILHIDLITLELGYGLIVLAKSADKTMLSDQIKALRKQIAEDLGFIVPSVRIVDNLELDSETYVIKIKNIECGRFVVYPNMYLVMNSTGGEIDVPGTDTKEPAFGLQAKWISAEIKEEAVLKNYTVIDPSTVIITHITEVIKDNITDLFSYKETQKLIDEISEEHKKLVNEIIPGLISISSLQRILLNLLAESVSIRDLPLILEAISEAINVTKNLNYITEVVRLRLSRQISYSLLDSSGMLPIVTLSAAWEKEFASSLIGSNHEEKQLAMDPSKVQEFTQDVSNKLNDLASKGLIPVIVTSAGIRMYVRTIISRVSHSTTVLSQNEIHSKVQVKVLGQI